MTEANHQPALLRWIHACLQRHLQTHGHRLLQASGALGDLYVSPAEARATLSRSLHDSLVDTPADEIQRPQALLEALAQRLDLSEADAQLLLAAAAPALDVDLARLYTFAWADFSQKLPNVGFLAELTGQPRSRFTAQAPLVRRRLVRLVAPKRWGPEGPVLHRGVIAHEAVVNWLDQSDALPEVLAQAGQWQAPERIDMVLPPGWLARLTETIDGALGPAGRLILAGRTGSGRRSLVRAVLARHDRPVLHVRLARIADDQLNHALAAADVAACLHRGVVLLRVPSTMPADAVGQLTDHLEQAQAPHILLTSRGHLAALNVHRVEMPALDGMTQRRLWRRALSQQGIAADLLADAGAARFDLTPGAIHAAVQAFARAGDASPKALSAAVDAQIQHALGSLADPVHTTLTWDDVVLPDEVMAVLTEIQSQAQHRTRVFDEWGFRRKLSYGRGLSCLFAGPPGTGKTMAAGIMAAELGRPLYRVDLSRVVSKWVGETEKNLARVFDEAERAQVILFFDEADSLFAKRTQVQGAQDRFANLEVNYLLQRMEQFDGMSILTTNFERGLDEAFKRRLRFRVYFPMPDTEQRAELWRRMTPAALPISEGIRWRELARAFKFSGGNIKNVVLRAAFLAAAEDGIVTEALLSRAASAEKREMGRL